MNNQLSAPLMNEPISIDLDMKEMPNFIRYDEGFKSFLKTFFIGDVIISREDDFWEFITRETENNIKFPAISIWPFNYTMSNNMNGFSGVQYGPIIEKAVEIVDEETNEKKGSTRMLSRSARTIYFDISYQVTVWGLDRGMALQLLQEILFPLKQYGEYQIIYFDKPYTVSYKVDNSITDNSVFGVQWTQSDMYRYSFVVTTTGPIFDSKVYYNALSRFVDVKVRSKANENTETFSYRPDGDQESNNQ